MPLDDNLWVLQFCGCKWVDHGEENNRERLFFKG